LAAPFQLDLLQANPAGPDWPVRQSERARRMSARVFRDGRVEIVVPLRARPDAVARFVTQHRAWIERTQRRAQRAAPAHPSASRRLPVPDLPLPALAEHWRIEHEPGEGPARLHERTWPTDSVAAPTAGMDKAGLLLLRARPQDQTGMRRVLVDWLRERLRTAALALLPPLAASMDTDFSAIRIGCQRSRWGSCSRHGTVSLNCCLLFQSPAVLRYLLVHELAHRRHMNHSARFWQHVATHEPDWRALDRELSGGWRQVPPWVFARTEVME
jgi:predicted metal-dependent hydrolase